MQGLTAIFLTLFVELTAPRRRRISASLALESIPDIRTFLESLATSSKWNESTANRLTAVAEEALLTLLNHNDELDDDSRRQHLLLTVRKDGGSAIVEVTAAHGKDNLED